MMTYTDTLDIGCPTCGATYTAAEGHECGGVDLWAQKDGGMMVCTCGCTHDKHYFGDQTMKSPCLACRVCPTFQSNRGTRATVTICGHPVGGASHYPCTEPAGHVKDLGHGVEHRHDGAYLVAPA